MYAVAHHFIGDQKSRVPVKIVTRTFKTYVRYISYQNFLLQFFLNFNDQFIWFRVKL